MNTTAERERLSQAELLAWLNRELVITEMVTIYLLDKREPHSHSIYCALVPNADVERSLSSPTWDLTQGHGYPGAVRPGEYRRFGDDDGIEPLIIDRYFHGMRPDYRELGEEFRLFHRLYHDLKQNQYIKIDKDGKEQLVAIVEPNRIQVRLKEIRQFLAIKEMHLAVQFDCREHSVNSLKELGLAEGLHDQRDGLLCWGLNYGDFRGVADYQTFSRLLGKRLIPPLPKEKSGFWGFAVEESKKYVEFIIGVNENGDDILHTSDEGRVSNWFGANPGKPHYLTPVHFRKDVLDKYYQQTSKYSVEDGYLRCGGLWGMTIDNHHKDKVVAWLGDLGRDLSYEEQLHWRSYNIPPVGGISETFFKRQLMAEATDSDQLEHVFKYRYQKLQDSCEEKLGWSLLLPLAPEDAHYFESLRVPANNEQKDFDDLVLALTKTLVDSLNEKELNKLIPASERDESKRGISRLENALAARGVQGAESHIKFLRSLQDLRSSGTAHRKGSNYRKIAKHVGTDGNALPTVFQGILTKGIAFLDYLDSVVNSGGLTIVI